MMVSLEYSPSLVGSPSIYSCAFSNDGNWFAVGIGSNVKILDVDDSFNVETTIANSCSYIKGVAFSPDSSKIAFVCDAGDDDDVLKVYDVSGWSSNTSFEQGHFQPSFSADGDYLAYNSNAGETSTPFDDITVRYVSNWSVAKNFTSMTEGALYGNVEFSNDGNWLGCTMLNGEPGYCYIFNVTDSEPPSIEEQCYYNLSGLSNGSSGNITWSGQADTSVWSNASDWGAGGYLAIEVSTNDSVTVDDIYIDFGDFENLTDGSGHYINITKINIEVSNNSANGSWWNGTTYDLSNSLNVSLNQSVGWMHNNSFPVTNNSVGVDETFYVRFKLDIPSGAVAGTYATTNNTVYTVKWKTTE